MEFQVSRINDVVRTTSRFTQLQGLHTLDITGSKGPQIGSPQMTPTQLDRPADATSRLDRRDPRIERFQIQACRGLLSFIHGPLARSAFLDAVLTDAFSSTSGRAF